MIGRIVSEVNDQVSHAHSILELYPNRDMRRMATTLYCRIFDFFEKVFKWYESRWNRLKRSFSDDAVEKMLDFNVDITRYMQTLRSKADMNEMFQSRVTNLRVEQILEKLTELSSNLDQRFSEGMDFIHMNAGRGKALSNGDNSSAYETMLTDRLPSPQLNRSSPGLAILGADTPRISSGTEEEYEHSAAVYIEERTVNDLQKWLPEPRAIFLGLEGPQTTEDRSPSRLIARSIACLVRQCGAPVLYHACTIPAGNETLHELPEITGFCSLLQSLNDQLGSLARGSRASANSRILPSPAFASTDDLISLFKHNLATAPPLLVCIIEDFQCLDDPFETNTHLQRFFQVLREHGQSINQDQPQSHPVFKVLISTSGHSKTLRNELEPEEICCSDHNSRTLYHPGQAAPGRRPVMFDLGLMKDWMSS
jgi:hypothetical protein